MKITDVFKKPLKVPSVTITLEDHYIDVNGERYKLLKSDKDIVSNAFELMDKAKSVDVNDKDALVKTYIDMSDYIDSILGAGAVDKIRGEKPIGFMDLKNAMGAIINAVYISYDTATALNYE